MIDLAAATARLVAAGIGTPRVDAELLLAHVLGIPRTQLAAAHPTAEQAAEFANLVDRRAARVPLQHLTGTAPFRYLDLAVGTGVFVPRPETELLVDVALLDAPRIAVDLCAGSGALALALAAEARAAECYAVENDPAALKWLRRNAAGSAVTVVDADVRDPLLPQLAGRVDVVVSNPPYVPNATPVDLEVRADPATAVFAGPDGLAVIPHVIARAAELLRPGGLLVMEHDDSHGDAVPRLLRRDARWADVVDRPDLTGRPRFVTARRDEPHR